MMVRWLLGPLAVALTLSHAVLAASGQVPFSARPDAFQLESPLPYRTTSLTRTLEVGGSVAKQQTLLKLEFDGGAKAGDKRQYFLTVPDELVGSLSWLEASVGSGGSKDKVVVERLGRNAESKTSYYSIPIPPSASSTINLAINEVYNHITEPKPKLMAQDNQGQAMFWQGDLLAGVSGLQDGSDITVRVKAPTPKILSQTAPKGYSALHTAGSSTVVFTPKDKYSSIVSGTQIASVHYDQPVPVTSVRKLDRSIQVSHWANDLAVEDSLVVANDGPRLKGHFSRVTHQTQAYLRRPGAQAHVLTGLALALPANIHSPYYIDEVGNVSTSRFRPSDSKTQLPSQRRKNQGFSLLELVPRYPLMGGWNYTFSIGYQAELGPFLKKTPKGDKDYVLAVPFLTPIADVAIDEVEVKISLPEGASDVSVHPPFPVDYLDDKVITHTYLDTTGRPTIILRKTACSDKHAGDVIITYNYSPLSVLQKPLAVAAVSFAGFLAMGVLKRVSFTLGKSA